MIGGDTIRHGGGVAERGESEGGGGESTAQRDKWGGLPGKEES